MNSCNTGVKDGWHFNLFFFDIHTGSLGFLRVEKYQKPILAAGVVFFVSAILHEYLVFVCIHTRMFGYMTAFFMLHYLATVVETAIAKVFQRKHFFPSPIAIALHILWLVATAPLLIKPLLLIFPVDSWQSIVSNF
ncbi:hypothetical protein [Candidatus Uabimicrobium amorphum]|nr:hypothetical protein [Candidatus Uabimicrobium amorphum]